MKQFAHVLEKVWHRRAVLTAPALAVTLAAGLGVGAIAQDATPGTDGVAAPRPAHIHDGGCGEELGAVIVPLNDLTAPAGVTAGNTEAMVAETSVTVVPLTLDAMLASDHAINVHRSAEQIDDYIACGEIGGVIDVNGALAIGLHEQNNSGYTGIAYLTPGEDGASTSVSAFIAPTDEADDGVPTDADAAVTPAIGGATTETTATAEADATVEADDDATVTAEDADATGTVEADDATAIGEADATVTAEAEGDEEADLPFDLGTPDAEGTLEGGTTTDDDTDSDATGITDADMTATAEADDDQ